MSSGVFLFTLLRCHDKDLLGIIEGNPPQKDFLSNYSDLTQHPPNGGLVAGKSQGILGEILLMEEILHQGIWKKIPLFTWFYASRWLFRISSINSIIPLGQRLEFRFGTLSYVPQMLEF